MMQIRLPAIGRETAGAAALLLNHSLKVNRRAVCLAAAALAMQPLAVSSQSIPSREAAWLAGGHANTYWSMQDAIEQGLSLKVNGKDWHSHQIELRKQNRQTFREQTALIHAKEYALCSDSQEASDWAALRCRAHITVLSKMADVDCDSRRCVVVQFARFVLQNKDLYATIESAVRSPCIVIPRYADLQAKYQMREPRGGFSMHTSEVSERWLYCDTNRPIEGHLSPTSTPDVFAIRWSRPGLRPNLTSHQLNGE